MAKLQVCTGRVLQLQEHFFYCDHLHETNRTKDATIRASTALQKATRDVIRSPSHIYVANPLYKSADPGCTSHHHYSVVELTAIQNDYVPRGEHVPASQELLRARSPSWKGKPITEYHRIVVRRRVTGNEERTLAAAIVPPGPAVLNTIFTAASESLSLLVLCCGLYSSLPVDFLAKTSGKDDLRQDFLETVPFPQFSEAAASHIRLRVLRLNCLTEDYTELWRRVYNLDYTRDTFASTDQRLNDDWSNLRQKWTHGCALRTPLARRQALVEIDALVALALGLTAEELVAIYRERFPTLQKFERETYFDRRGRIVFTSNVQGLRGVGLKGDEWRQVRDAKARGTIPAFASAYEPPFDRCDREEDMAQAYHHFAKVLGIATAVPAESETRLKSVRPGDPARAPLAKTASAPAGKAKAAG